ncbi:zinc-binding dehydrogenase [Arthrobacter sp. efr-133-TYG-118]|uniref:zinc-dependent alcohol dehydrogenase n=1 Tax=Arthrobacter sp. efr-133-TYG-118 TaxID=3040279 RepID=UPI00254ECA3D|nr:zinc-binding dehydrogenase [Arthrobacter sp. efr-133-TYG-118]
MKAAIVTGPDQLSIREVETPAPGPTDVLVKMKACGLCGSDPHSLRAGFLVPGAPETRLGHEPAGAVVEVGAEVTGIADGDHVVINPMGVPDAIIGGGGHQGALSEYVLVRDAGLRRNLQIMPPQIPFHVAALVEPMSVARRAVNRTRPKPEDKVVVFGAGPVGLGGLLAYKALGVEHVVVVDVQTNRLTKALALGADAVVNSAEEDLLERLVALHGAASDAFGVQGLPGTDIYLDAAGVPSVVQTVLQSAKQDATLGIVAIHRKPIEVDFEGLIPKELTIVASMGYSEEFFQVADDLTANWEKYALIVSDVRPFEDVEDAIRLAGTPGTTDKVVVTFE